MADLVTPLIAAIGGEPSFDDLTFTINGSEFRYGHFINALLTFVIIAAVVFFFVVKPVNALMARMKTGEDVEEHTHKCPECRSDIPESARALRLLHRAGPARPPEGRARRLTAVATYDLVRELPGRDRGPRAEGLELPLSPEFARAHHR